MKEEIFVGSNGSSVVGPFFKKHAKDVTTSQELDVLKKFIALHAHLSAITFCFASFFIKRSSILCVAFKKVLIFLN